MKLEKLIPLPQAAARLGLTVEALTRLVDSGTIKANIHEGVVLIPESQVKQAITREQFVHLKGTPITMAEASEKYGPTVKTIWSWVARKYIAKLDDAYPVHVDEADVAYCAAVYKSRGKSSRLFDEAGRPYVLKRPEIAAYRQRRAKQAQPARARA
jgi:hypothetical protein